MSKEKKKLEKSRRLYLENELSNSHSSLYTSLQFLKRLEFISNPIEILCEYDSKKDKLNLFGAEVNLFVTYFLSDVDNLVNLAKAVYDKLKKPDNISKRDDLIVKITRALEDNYRDMTLSVSGTVLKVISKDDDDYTYRPNIELFFADSNSNLVDDEMGEMAVISLTIDPYPDIYYTIPLYGDIHSEDNVIKIQEFIYIVEIMNMLDYEELLKESSTLEVRDFINRHFYEKITERLGEGRTDDNDE